MALNLRRFVVERAISAIAAPEVAVPIDLEAIKSAEISGVNDFGLVRSLAVL